MQKIPDLYGGSHLADIPVIDGSNDAVGRIVPLAAILFTVLVIHDVCLRNDSGGRTPVCSGACLSPKTQTEAFAGFREAGSAISRLGDAAPEQIRKMVQETIENLACRYPLPAKVNAGRFPSLQG